MRQWKNAFRIWKTNCPYIKRILYTKDDFVKWAKDLKLFRSLEEDDFYVFINFLEECEILCPLTFSRERFYFGFGLEKFTDYVSSEPLIAYYHPLQFFDIINWYKFRSLKRPPFFYSERFRKYYALRKLQFKIQKKKTDIKSTKEMGLSTEYMEEYLIKLEKELNEKQDIESSFPQGKELLFYLNIGFTQNLLNEDYLIVWIKLESLLLQHDAAIFAPNPPDMRLMLTNTSSDSEVQRCINDYREWRETIINDRENYLTEKEIKELKNFYHFLGHEIGYGDFGTFGTRGNWIDLFDIIQLKKKNKLLGFTSYYVNLLNIKRYIERAYWELFEKNIMYRIESDTKPYFYTDGIEEMREYFKSVLVHFNLFTSNPFFLYVEGGSEINLLSAYLEQKKGIRFNLRNMVGIDSAAYHKRICEDTEDREYYFFFDYDNLERYETNKEKYGTNCSFFFPDFITENFTVDQFYNAFISWIEDINLNLNEDQKSEIYSKLEQEKQYSNEIISEIESSMDIARRITHGFEDIIINFLRYDFPREIHEQYDDIQLDHNGRISNLDDFKSIVKTEIIERLKPIITESMKRDPKRAEKFRFEIKLNPFYEKLIEIINRVPYYA